MSDQQSNDPNKIVNDPNGFYLPGAVLLDVYHHNQPEMHKFGEAFHMPVPPPPNATIAFEGISDTPAREDHVHSQNLNGYQEITWQGGAGVGGVIDNNVNTIVAPTGGAGRFEIISEWYGGFSSGAPGLGRGIFYTNQVSDPRTFGLTGDPVAQTNMAAASTWYPLPCVCMVIPTTSGQSITITGRGIWTNAAVNCWFKVYLSWRYVPN